MMPRPASLPSGVGWDEAPGTGRFDPDAPARGWDDLREAQVRFDRRGDWSVEAPAGVETAFRRAADADGAWHGRWEVRGAASADRLRLRPTAPILLAEPFDTVEIGLGLAAPDPEAAATFAIALVLEDADGQPLRIPLDGVPVSPDGEAVLLHRNLGHTFLEEARFPFRWTGIEVSGWPASAILTVEPIAFYPECRVPLVPGWRLPGRTRRTPLYEQLGHPPELPPPGRDPAGGVPRPPDPPPRHARHREPDGSWTLEARTGAGTAAYRVPPPAGGRAVALLWNGREVGAWAGLDVEPAEAGPPAAYPDGPSAVVWAWPGGREQRFALEGASLVVTLRGGRDVEAVRLGGLRGDFVPTPAPFLDDDPEAIPVRYARAYAGHAGALFVALAADVSVSGASGIERAEGASGGAVHVYRPATDGRRPWLRERAVLTLGESPAAVLPTPPWAPADGGQNAAVESRPWLGPDAAPEAADPEARFAAFGMDEWFRIGTACPGGEAPLCRTLAQDEIAPADARWSRDDLRRTSAGHWMPGSAPGRYRLARPAVRADARARLADEGRAFDLPVVEAQLTALSPWAFTNYDARAPGAGGFLAGYEALAGQLQDWAEFTGALRIGDDRHVSAYAGALDGWVVSAARGQRLFHGPAWPEMAQQALRPYGVGIGAGPLEAAVATHPDHPNADAALDRYIAVQLAYGLALRTPPLRYGAARVARLYYAAGVVARARAGRPVERLAFLDDPPRAPGAGERLYVRYAGGLELWVNLASAGDWTVRVAGETYRLPPSGWIARGEGVLALSAADGEGRFDAAVTPDLRYRDGRGRPGRSGGLRTAGAVVLRRDPRQPGAVEVFDFDGREGWALEGDPFGLGPDPHVEAWRMPDGVELPAPVLVREDGRLRAAPAEAPARLRLRRADAPH